MQRLTPMFVLKGKLICLDCVDVAPIGAKWELHPRVACSNAKNHGKRAVIPIKPKRRKTG